MGIVFNPQSSLGYFRGMSWYCVQPPEQSRLLQRDVWVLCSTPRVVQVTLEGGMGILINPQNSLGYFRGMSGYCVQPPEQSRLLQRDVWVLCSTPRVVQVTLEGFLGIVFNPQSSLGYFRGRCGYCVQPPEQSRLLQREVWVLCSTPRVVQVTLEGCLGIVFNPQSSVGYFRGMSGYCVQPPEQSRLLQRDVQVLCSTPRVVQVTLEGCLGIVFNPQSSLGYFRGMSGYCDQPPEQCMLLQRDVWVLCSTPRVVQVTLEGYLGIVFNPQSSLGYFRGRCGFCVQPPEQCRLLQREVWILCSTPRVVYVTLEGCLGIVFNPQSSVCYFRGMSRYSDQPLEQSRLLQRDFWVLCSTPRVVQVTLEGFLGIVFNQFMIKALFCAVLTIKTAI